MLALDTSVFLDRRIDALFQTCEIMELPLRKGGWLRKESIAKTTNMAADLPETMANMLEMIQKVVASVALAVCETS